MIGHKRHRIAMVVLAVWVAVALLAACGDATKKSTSPAANSGQAATDVGLSTCATCHTVAVTDWLTSRHANLDPTGALDSPGLPTLGEISGCTQNCHDPNGDSGKLTPGYTGDASRPVIGCEACHGAGSLHAAEGGAGPINRLSNASGTSQFVMCTSCHQLLDSAGTGTVAAAHDVGGAEAVSASGANYSITDTHFATPGDWPTSANTKDITGYAMDVSADKVCTNCHDPHKPASQNREWAQSAHSDKNSQNLNATKTGYFSGAWAHYNWSSRPTCMRCKTTTAFIAYADALRTGNKTQAAAINAGTADPAPMVSDTSYKPEMLHCNGCHVDYSGSLRNPGAITANYDYTSSGKTYSRASHTYPDVNASNVCMACHTARESGETLKGLNDASLLSSGSISSFDFSKGGFINSHYLTAGGTVFTATGFEFNNRDYDNISSYRHQDIGTSAVPNTGSNGPCVGCHMSRPGNNGDHLFMPVSRSTTTWGLIESVASEVCIYCHTVSGAGGLEELLNERKEEYREAVEAAIYVLDKRGTYFMPDSPYIFASRATGTMASVATNSNTVAVATTTGVKDIENSLNPDYFKVDSDGTYYSIRSVIDGTTLQLDENYAGLPGSNLAYTIIQFSTSSLRTKSTSSITAQVTQGSATVTVVGALYSSGAVTITPSSASSSKPDYFKVTGIDDTYKISSVEETGVNTSVLTLEKDYAGSDNANAGFSVLKSGDSGLRDWLTKAGSGITPASASDTNTDGRTTGRYNMGAAFNLNLMEHEPGAYVHNRMYAKRLLYDAMDWADDNQMNNSVGTTLSNVAAAVYTWKAGAMKYLLPSGVLAIEAERP